MAQEERQVAKTLDGIREDHRARYEFAANRLAGTVLDVGCGIGYGSKILSDSVDTVVGYEQNQEAIGYGLEHYRADNVTLVESDVSQQGFIKADAAVCFEVVEHLKDPRPMLKSLAGAVGRLIVSTPNEDVIKWGMGNYEYHHRHYTKNQFEALLAECGWQVDEWHGQHGPLSQVVSGKIDGMTLIAVCSHAPDSLVITVEDTAGKKVPESVAIIGLGPSKHEYASAVCGAGDRRKVFDETWVINAAASAFEHDMVLHMDDFRIQEIRAEARPGSNIAAMIKLLKNHNKPILTSRAYPEYPTSFEMPLEALINDLKYDYFNSTAAWGMAYAIHIGVKKVGIFGCDFAFKNRHEAERGRGCLEFWMGYGAARGVRFVFAKSTTLMDACEPRHERLYGYDTRRAIFDKDDEGIISVKWEEVETLPTADEIEWRYNHDRHPNPIAEEADEQD